MQIAEMNLNFDAKQIYMRFAEGGSKTVSGTDFTTLCGEGADTLRIAIEAILNVPETLAALEAEKAAKVEEIDTQISVLQAERAKVVAIEIAPIEKPVEEVIIKEG